MHKRRIALFSALPVVVILLYWALTSHSWAHYTTDKGLPCQQPRADLLELTNLVHLVDDVFTDLDVAHYLIYGSLIGALRYAGPLPWDYDADVGVDGDALCRHTEEEIVDAFRQRGTRYEESISTRGRSTVYYKKERVDVMPFYDYWRDGWMRRRGVESWVIFINYRRFHTFPSRLVRQPLAVAPFSGRNIECSARRVQSVEVLVSR